MSRDEILQFALDAAKDDYLRAQSRLGLVETKAQLVSATVGILLTFFVTIPPDHIAHSHPVHGVLLIAAVGSLIVSLVLSIAASFLVDVRPPQSAADIAKKSQELIKEPGDTATTVDGAAGERMVGNLVGSYVTATKEVALLLAARMKRLKTAQSALVVGIFLMIVLIGLPYLSSAIVLFKTGVHSHG